MGIKYQVISEDCLEYLVAEVNHMIHDGWEVIGGINSVVTSISPFENLFMQAIYKKERNS